MKQNYFLRMFISNAYCCLAIILFVVSTGEAQTIRYVKQGGTGTGASWADASGNLQNMINASVANDEVWVAAGTYLPTVIAGTSTQNRDKSFILKNNVKMYGGFPATGTPVWTDRNWVDNQTILSGDLGTLGNTADNAYHVVLAAGPTGNPFSSNTVLDGFVISGGNANASSAYINVVNGYSIYSNDGGGIYMVNGGITMRNNVITANFSSSHGGGIYITNSTPSLSYSKVSGNIGAYGGGISCENNGSLTLDHVIVNGNTGTYDGGGIELTYFELSAVNCAITGNNSTQFSGDGGGIFSHGNSAVTLINSTISGNYCTGYGGGINNSYSCPLIVQNCIIYGNSSGIYNLNTDEGQVVYYNSLIQNLVTTENGNLGGTANPFFTNAPAFTTAPFTGGDYTIGLSCSPAINSGNNSFVIAGTTTDLAGNPRIYEGVVVDMGAYEYQADIVNIPPTSVDQNFLWGATVADLVATGSNLQWYLTATGGEPLTAATALESGTYYVSQTVNSCESTRTAVQVTITIYTVRYIREGATGDGSSWANASGDLQAMINTPMVEEVWVAAGTYKPEVIPGDGTTNRDKTILLKDNVKVYGGFPASGSPAFEDRNWETNQTVLSGDLGVLGDISDNAHHVVVTITPANMPATGETILDGFIIRDGNATSANSGTSIHVNGYSIMHQYGGGIFVTWNSSPTLRNLLLTNNNGQRGGALYVDMEATVWLANSDLTNSTAVFGGGLYNRGDLAMTDVNVTDNSVDGDGGGIYNQDGIYALNNGTVSNNTCVGNGAGLHSDSGTGTLNNVFVQANVSTGSGGGIFNNGNSLTLLNVQITGNVAAGSGAGVRSTWAILDFTNVTISGNKITMGNAGVPPSGGMFNQACDVVNLKNCVLFGNTGGVVDFVSTSVYTNSLIQGINNTTNGNISGNIDPLFVNAPSADSAPFATGDYNLLSSSPLINAGSNTLYTAAGGDIANDFDLANNARVFENEGGGIVDIGAYEYQGNPGCTFTTVWNGTAWSNGVPESYEYAAIISGNYISSGDLTACSLTISAGNVTIQSGDTFDIKGSITVNNALASLTVENNGAIVQEDNVPNSGMITFKQLANPLFINQHTLWSAPVSGQNFQDFSPQTTADGFFTYSPTSDSNEEVGEFAEVDPIQSFIPAMGNLIRMPQSVSGSNAAPYAAGTYSFAYEGVFTGVPNNGNVSATLNTTGDFYTAIGNPYPSPISVEQFFNAGSAILDPASAIYLWSNSNNAVGYAMLSSTTFVANDPNSGGSLYSGNPSEWTISAGQGFLVQSNGQANSFTFNNSMRRLANTSQQFFRDADTNQELSRIWLNLTNAGGAFQQVSVAYKEGATYGIDAGLEGKLLSVPEAVQFYTLAETTPLVIQTRPAFTDTDIVPLGYKAIVAGDHTIALSDFDGLFSADQNIYLHDVQNAALVNLKQSSYTFTTAAGTFEARFQIVYSNSLNISEVQPGNNNVMIYKNNGTLEISAGNAILHGVTLYDLSGRKLYDQSDINSSTWQIDSLMVKDQVIIASITTNYGRVTRKILY